MVARGEAEARRGAGSEAAAVRRKSADFDLLLSDLVGAWAAWLDHEVAAGDLLGPAPAGSVVVRADRVGGKWAWWAVAVPTTDVGASF